jgi:hypothetical protein
MWLRQLLYMSLGIFCTVSSNKAQLCDKSRVKITNVTEWKVQVDYEAKGKKDTKVLQTQGTTFLINPMRITNLTVEPEGRFWSIDSVPRLVGDWIRSKNLMPEVQKLLQDNGCKDVEIKIGLPAKLSEDFRTFNIKIGTKQ